MGTFSDSKLSQDTSQSLKLRINRGDKCRLNTIWGHWDRTLKP